MSHDLVEAVYLDGYRLRVVFKDGASGVADLTSIVQRGGIFDPLADPERFRACRVNHELGVLEWDCGADIAPETLYSLATGSPLPPWMVDSEPAGAVREDDAPYPPPAAG